MFKEYVYWGQQANPESSQSKVGIDLMAITGYLRNPTNNSIAIYGAGGHTVHMTQAEFDEFKTQLKTANRLKRVYE